MVRPRLLPGASLLVLTGLLAALQGEASGLNDFPLLAFDDEFTVAHNGALDVPDPGLAANDSHGGLRGRLVWAVRHPDHGMLVQAQGGCRNPQCALPCSGGSFYYRPDPTFTGTDRFTYRLMTLWGQSSREATVTVHVTNAAPVARPDRFDVPSQGCWPTRSRSVSANDTDADRDCLTAHLVRDARHGKVYVFSDGTFSYAPKEGFTGEDTFTYRVNDTPGADSEPAVVTLNVRDDLPAESGLDDTVPPLP